METEVRIAELKARLSEHLRSVRQGNSITIKDRTVPIARLVPYDSAAGRPRTIPATRSMKDVERELKKRKRISVPVEAVEKALRETRKDWFDKWLESTLMPR